MGLSAEVEEDIFKKHQDLCVELNLDKESAHESWNSYLNIRQNYTLEVRLVVDTVKLFQLGNQFYMVYCDCCLQFKGNYVVF